MHLISALKQNQIDNGKNIKIYIFFYYYIDETISCCTEEFTFPRLTVI